MSLLRLGAIAFLLLGMGGIYLPMGLLAWQSFHSEGTPGWTIDWYIQVLNNPRVLEAAGLSLRIALSSAIMSVTLGTLFAWGGAKLARQSPFERLLWIPLVLPEIVLGLSLLVWFSLLRWTLGEWSILVAHVIFSVTFVVFAVQARLREREPHLEEAARDLGATEWQVFWRVTVPDLLPAMMTGGAVAFTLSFDDFLLSFFLSGVESETLPMKVYSMVRFGVSREIHALSTLMVTGTLLLFLVSFRWKSKLT